MKMDDMDSVLSYLFDISISLESLTACIFLQKICKSRVS